MELEVRDLPRLLGTSESAVRHHVSAINRKCGTRNLAELARGLLAEAAAGDPPGAPPAAEPPRARRAPHG